MDHSQAVLYGYHPESLSYRLIHEETIDTTRHPRQDNGPADSAVGVHDIHTAVSWDTIAPGQHAGTLHWHAVELAHWTGTREAFAAAHSSEQAHALTAGPRWDRGKWGTHLGATMTVVTSDQHVVLRSRAGKYAEDHLYDSLLAGTLMTSDITSSDYTTTDYLRLLCYQAGISLETEVDEFHPTHLAMRRADFGLWIGGWLSTGLTAAQVAARVPFPTVAIALDQPVNVPLTPWARFDLDAQAIHRSGRHLHDALWLP